MYAYFYDKVVCLNGNIKSRNACSVVQQKKGHIDHIHDVKSTRPPLLLCEDEDHSPPIQSRYSQNQKWIEHLG